MNKIISIREYEGMLNHCNSKGIVEEDLRIFTKQKKQIEALIKRAEKELKGCLK